MPLSTLLARPDGRLANALRPVTIERNYIRHAPGSVLIAVGHTKVLVTVSIEDRVPRHIYGKEGHGWLTAEYAMLPGATNTRNSRDRYKISGRTSEIQRLIGRTLRTSIDLTQLGQRTLTIDADVLQADGGTRTAAITAASIALHDAVATLMASGQLKANPIKHRLAAISVGLVNGQAVLDLNYDEDSNAQADANVVMNDAGQLVEVQFSSEQQAFDRTQLNEMLDLAQHGITQLLQLGN